MKNIQLKFGMLTGTLGVDPCQDASGKRRFIRIPYHSPVTCSWSEVRQTVYCKLVHWCAATILNHFQPEVKNYENLDDNNNNDNNMLT